MSEIIGYNSDLYETDKKVIEHDINIECEEFIEKALEIVNENNTSNENNKSNENVDIGGSGYKVVRKHCNYKVLSPLEGSHMYVSISDLDNKMIVEQVISEIFDGKIITCFLKEGRCIIEVSTGKITHICN